MAQVILTAAGTALGGPIGGAIGGVLGGLADRALVSALAEPRQVGGRLSGLELHSTSVGAPMPAVFGRARVAGQTIWAARFREKRVETRTGGGKGGGARTVAYAYSLSFAVALGEGPVDGVGRIWADGAVMDMAGVTMRLHKGGPDQLPDPLIEAVEGAAPAYRGVAYLVFEDLPLDTWGNRPPQLNVEVFRRPASEHGLEEKLKSVNLIPGAGEFVLDPAAQLRVTGAAAYAHENVHNAQGRPDLMVALDQLQAQLPNVDHVNLVVAWFGTDLRCGVCECRPGVEREDKVTTPAVWRVEVDRTGAHVISESDGGPAYGGTPSDASVLACIAELRRRGLAVTLYPFLMMDVAADNALPDPYGGPRQAAYPWRGRITGAVAPGGSGTTDKTAAAAAQAAAFFGAAAPSHFSAGAGGVAYAGPAEWRYRRLVLHYARLAAMSEGVEGFLIGSELRGLTTLRSAAGVYPAVAHLKTLAADVRAMLGSGVKVGYAADWSEYFGHQPAGEGGEVRFHLDPLWADPNIDFVGVDFYPPLADWRAGAGGVDAAAGAKGPHDPDYLAANVTGGENADWFYASPSARGAQTRTPVADGAYGEPWVFRSKDLAAWWGHAHHDRPGGVRATTPTGWSPGMKPIRLVEFGCPAVDRGANSPNLFIDPKSSESGLPVDSTGARDDMIQRRGLEAVLGVYGENPMVERLSAWCWDARPYPDFPARSDVWRDGPNWRLGHWLTGRVGQGGASDLVRAVLDRAGFDAEAAAVEGVSGQAFGYVVPGPMSTADALRPLAEALGFDPTERDGKVVLLGRNAAIASAELDAGDLALADDAPDPRRASRTLEPAPDLVRVRYLDEADAYQAASVVRRAVAPGGAGPTTVELPVVLDAAGATAAADRRLRDAGDGRDTLTVAVAPSLALQAQPGDVLAFDDEAVRWRVVRVEWDETPSLQLSGVTDGDAPSPDPQPPSPPAPEPVPEAQGPPVLHMLDLPPLPGAEDDARPLAAVAAHPWRPFDVHAGPGATSLSPRARAEEPAAVGVALTALAPGPLHRWDRGSRLQVRMAAGAGLVSRSEAEVRAGANALAVRGPGGEWEVVQFLSAAPLGGDVFELSGLLRGQLGTEAAMGSPLGAAVVLLDRAAARCDVQLSERGAPLLWRAAPAGGPVGGPAATDTPFAWRGVAARPWSPAAFRARRSAGGMSLRWSRRPRLHGDVWDGEPPLGETRERYRLDVLEGAASGGYVLDAPSRDLTPSDLTTSPYRLVVEVRQWSELWGYGPPLHRELWL